MNGRRVIGFQGLSFRSGRSISNSCHSSRRPSGARCCRPAAPSMRSSCTSRSTSSAGRPRRPRAGRRRRSAGAAAVSRPLRADRPRRRETEKSASRVMRKTVWLDLVAGDHRRQEVQDRVLDRNAGAVAADLDEPRQVVGHVDADEPRRRRDAVGARSRRCSARATARAGTGAAAPTAIGVRSGSISRRNRFVSDRSSRPVHSSTETMRMPSAASAGRSSSSQSAVLRLLQRARPARARRRASEPASVRRESAAGRPTRSARAGRRHAPRRTRRGSTRRSRRASRARAAARRVRRELEHALVELEPRELAVEEARGPLGRIARDGAWREAPWLPPG